MGSLGYTRYAVGAVERISQQGKRNIHAPHVQEYAQGPVHLGPGPGSLSQVQFTESIGSGLELTGLVDIVMAAYPSTE
ncbi:MAG: hypothetical protein M0Z41_15885 [Peptococcaceae bacterium]|jgi:hypothetical protein|nr:hypothetical protein [Peptococcaceae bacterium]